MPRKLVNLTECPACCGRMKEVGQNRYQCESCDTVWLLDDENRLNLEEFGRRLAANLRSEMEELLRNNTVFQLNPDTDRLRRKVKNAWFFLENNQMHNFDQTMKELEYEYPTEPKVQEVREEYKKRENARELERGTPFSYYTTLNDCIKVIQSARKYKQDPTDYIDSVVQEIGFMPLDDVEKKCCTTVQLVSEGIQKYLETLKNIQTCNNNMISISTDISNNNSTIEMNQSTVKSGKWYLFFIKLLFLVGLGLVWYAFFARKYDEVYLFMGAAAGLVALILFIISHDERKTLKSIRKREAENAEWELTKKKNEEEIQRLEQTKKTQLVNIKTRLTELKPK